MRVLLIAANREQYPDPVFPLGLSYIASLIEGEGHQLQLLDLCFAGNPGKALKKTIQQFRPQVVGITLRNIDNALYPRTVSYIPYYREIVNQCRACSDAVIVLGGPALTIMRGTLLDYLEADIGLAGEGEEAFPWLLENIDSPRVLKSKPWIILKGEEDKSPESAPMETPLDCLPFPDRGLFPNKLYYKWGGAGNIQTKRGCGFNCIYCTYPHIEGRCLRLRSAEGVVDEMEYLVYKLGQKRVYIVDSVFNNPPEHAEIICAEILRRNLKLSWGCFINPGLVSEGLVRMMARAGCAGLEMGTDTAHQGMLDNLGKDFEVEDIVRASKLFRKAGIEVCHTLLFGGPGETPESIKSTCRVMEGVGATAIVALTGVRVFPHTPLAETAFRETGLSAEKRFPEPFFYVSPAVEKFMLDYLRRFAASRGRWVLPGLAPPLNTNLHHFLRGLGIKLPLWELLKYRLFRHRGKLPGLKLP